MKKIIILLVCILLIPSAFALTIFEEDWEEGNFDQWEKLYVGSNTETENLDDDVSIGNNLSLRWDENYAQLKDDAGIIAEIDASSCEEDAEVSYVRKVTKEGSTDKLITHWKVEGGSWGSPLATGSAASWTAVSKTLFGSAGNNILLRFYLNNGDGSQGLLDDIVLTCKGLEVPEPEDIPEFTAVTSLLVLGCVGLYLYRRR